MSLRGSVPEFPLEAVLRFLLTSGKTGVLQVTGARGQGSVGLDAGRLVSASSSEDVDQGDEALGALLALAAAEFDFRPGDLMGPESLSGDTEAILARACSERDRTLRIREIVPHDRLVFRLSDRAAVRTKIELTSDEWRTLLAVNGARDVAGVAAVLHVRSRAALMLLDGLVRAGTVDTEEPPAGQLPPVARSAASETPPAPAVASAPESSPAQPTESWFEPPTGSWSAPAARPPRVDAAEPWLAAAAEPRAADAAEPWSATADGSTTAGGTEPWPAPEVPLHPATDPGSWSAPGPLGPLAWSASPSPSEWSVPNAAGTPEATVPTADSAVDDRLAALGGMFASSPAPALPVPTIVRPAVVPPPFSAPAPPPAPAPSPTPSSAPVAPPAKQRGGLFGFGRKIEPAATAVTPTLTIATTRAGKLGSFANALIEEYNSGRYGKGRVEGKITKLLLRVDEQADPIDRPIPTVGDALSVSGLDAGLIPEAQAVPYLAFLVTQIHGDAERAFGRDKAKQGYQVARRQTLPDDPLLGSADLLGRLPRF